MPQKPNILLVADAASSHTVKWAQALIDRGLRVHVFSFRPTHLLPSSIVTVAKHYPTAPGRFKKLRELRYFYTTSELKQCIASIQPDIVHAHYASSYGMIARRAAFHPFYISVWGSDVFSFPRSGQLTKSILQKNLNAADHIFSTSHVMSKETQQYTNTAIDYTPFGVDTSRFIFSPKTSTDTIHLGTMKSLETIYGIDLVIHAIKWLSSQSVLPSFHLHIYGDGSKMSEYQALAASMDLNTFITFHGRIDPQLVPAAMQSFDILVNPSREESFGVAVVEAMASGAVPVVSNVGGLTEVVDHDINGIHVPAEDADALGRALLDLMQHPEKRQRLALAARAKVEREYDWNKMIDNFIQKYYLSKS
ncbi:MAG: glycosyltransferase [Flavobacteriales bacterium]